MISCKNSGVPRFQMPEKLSTGANGQKVDAASFFCQCSFDELSWLSVQFWSSCHRMPVTLVALLRTQEFARPGRLGVVAWVGLGSDRAAWSSSDSLIEKILLILSHRRQVWGILTFPSPALTPRLGEAEIGVTVRECPLNSPGPAQLWLSESVLGRAKPYDCCSLCLSRAACVFGSRDWEQRDFGNIDVSVSC